MPPGADRATGPVRVLSELVRATSGAQDGDAVLRAAAQVLAGEVAHVVLADRLHDPDVVVRVAAVSDEGPLPLPLHEGGERSRRSSASSTGLLAQLREAPVPVLRLGTQRLRALAASGEPRVRAQAELGLALGVQEIVLLGAGARGRLGGVLSVGRHDRAFTEAEVELLLAAAAHVGLALEAARLADAQRDVSAAMQRSLLPPLPRVPGLVLAARYQAAAPGLDVGGDWYDAFVLPEGALALVIGDATGHDTAAAADMAGLRNQLRALAVDRAEQPAAVLTRLDRTDRVLGGEASGTCLYARLEPEAAGRRLLRWSSAGHLPPVLVHAGHARLADTAPDLMLGVDPDTPRADHTAELAPGDLALLCTDGLVEDRRTPLDVRLELLRALVEEHAGDHPEQLAEAVLGELGQARGDDVALLVVQVAPSG